MFLTDVREDIYKYNGILTMFNEYGTNKSNNKAPGLMHDK
jgi:hypothetical protein